MIRRPPRSTLYPCTTLCRARQRHPAESRPQPDPQRRQQGGGEQHQEHHVLPAHREQVGEPAAAELLDCPRVDAVVLTEEDRKSTRLNSSHANISYAVFCLKK